MAKKEEYNPIIFDDFNGRIKADQSCIGTLTTNCGNDAERNGVKITEMEAPITTRGNDIAGAIRASLYRQGERNIRRNIEDGKGYEGVIEPCICAARGRQSETDGWQQKLEVGDSQTSNALTTVQKDNLVLEQNELARCKEIGEMRGGKWENTMEKSRRVYGVDGLSTTCTTCGGGNQEIKVMVKNATKQGYLEATVGDGIDIGSRQNSHRDTVQKGMAQTLKTSPEVGVIEPNCIDGMFAGGWSKEEIEKHIEENGLPVPTYIERYISDSGGETCGTYLSQSGTYGYRKPIKDCARTLKAENNDSGVIQNYRIRKLTPKECFRLMGVKDADFDRVAKNQSDSSLYHLAGDSIVVNVLAAIFKEMI